jgi:hypothetical protein
MSIVRIFSILAFARGCEATTRLFLIGENLLLSGFHVSHDKRFRERFDGVMQFAIAVKFIYDEAPDPGTYPHYRFSPSPSRAGFPPSPNMSTVRSSSMNWRNDAVSSCANSMKRYEYRKYRFLNAVSRSIDSRASTGFIPSA